MTVDLKRKVYSKMVLDWFFIVNKKHVLYAKILFICFLFLISLVRGEKGGLCPFWKEHNQWQSLATRFWTNSEGNAKTTVWIWSQERGYWRTTAWRNAKASSVLCCEVSKLVKRWQSWYESIALSLLCCGQNEQQMLGESCLHHGKIQVRIQFSGYTVNSPKADSFLRWTPL